MATETISKISVGVLVNNGTTQTGAIKLATVALGKMSITGYDAAKCLSVATVLEPCLSKTIQEIRKTTISKIEE